MNRSHMLLLALMMLSLASTACSSDTTGGRGDAIDDTSDADADGVADTRDEPDASDTRADGDDVADAGADAEVVDDADPGDAADDGSVEDGAPDAGDGSGWDHMTRFEPPRLEWSTCDRTADGTLASKAAYYDWIVPALHQVQPGTSGHEDWSRVFAVTCDAPVPTAITPAESLPTCTFDLSENNGLWTSLYIASQAFRYAATAEGEALENVLRTLRATRRMTDITGTPGLFTRDFRDPALPSQYCPSDPMEYVPMGRDMVGNRWVRVGEDGCILTYAPGAEGAEGEWVRDGDHCTDRSYAGYCWQRNVSKDEYSGHYYAASVVAKLVDDEEAQALAASILRDATWHLIRSEYWIADYDGRKTRYGSAHAMSLDHIPGFNAFLALSWTRSAASVTREAVFGDFYERCLLARGPAEDCIDQDLERGVDYRTHLSDFALKVGCQTNYDNVSIMTLAYTGLMLLEPEAELRDTYREAFHRNSRGPDVDGRDLWSQGNAHLNFTLASLMGETPRDPDAARSLVHDGVCALYAFHSDNVSRAVDNSDVETVCVSRRHGDLAAEPLPLPRRCSSVFEWWGDPNEIEFCAGNPNRAQPPAAYLLPYWMGRYNEFISAEM